MTTLQSLFAGTWYTRFANDPGRLQGFVDLIKERRERWPHIWSIERLADEHKLTVEQINAVLEYSPQQETTMGKRANADLSLMYIGNRLHDAAHSRGEYDAYMDASKIVMDNAVYLFKLGKFKRALALRRQSIELERVADEIKLRNVNYWTQRDELKDELLHRDVERGEDATKG